MEIKEAERKLQVSRIRGCLFGGAVGDARGYPVEFLREKEIFSQYGSEGIRQYHLDDTSGKALISDDTQMSLFTAVGLLVGDTRGCMRGDPDLAQKLCGYGIPGLADYPGDRL